MSIYQSLRYSAAFSIDSISNIYTLITIHELKPWGFFAFKNRIIIRSSIVTDYTQKRRMLVGCVLRPIDSEVI